MILEGLRNFGGGGEFEPPPPNRPLGSPLLGNMWEEILLIWQKVINSILQNCEQLTVGFVMSLCVRVGQPLCRWAEFRIILYLKIFRHRVKKKIPNLIKI